MLLCTVSTLRLWMILCNQETKCATSMLMEFFKSFIGLSNLMDPGSLGIMFAKVKIDALLLLQLGNLCASIPIAKDNERERFCQTSLYANRQNQVASFSCYSSCNCWSTIHLYENTLPRILIIFCFFCSISDGRLYTATPVDPVFILLPVFEEARMKVCLFCCC